VQRDLSEADDGTSIEVVPGDALVVRLRENPTTGYRWALDELDGDAVTLGGDDFEASEGAGVGSGGRRIFTFSAVGPGSASIALKLWRRWEGDASARERVRLNVRVAAQEADATGHPGS
jgi:inhibitor of cysteine peptidase